MYTRALILLAASSQLGVLANLNHDSGYAAIPSSAVTTTASNFGAVAPSTTTSAIPQATPTLPLVLVPCSRQFGCTGISSNTPCECDLDVNYNDWCATNQGSLTQCTSNSQCQAGEFCNMSAGSVCTISYLCTANSQPNGPPFGPPQ
jgi:hypothetical protein